MNVATYKLVMEKEENYTENIPGSFARLEYSMDQQQHHHHIMKQRSLGESSTGDNNNGLVDYMLNNVQHQHEISTNSASLERLSFADVMQFADFGPKLALNHTKISEEDNNIDDPVYFLKFPVLNDRMDDHTSFIIPEHNERFKDVDEENKAIVGGDDRPVEDEEARVSDSMSLQPRFLGGDPMKSIPVPELKNKRKRPRSLKTSEEVESQRMTHIAVERNRRKQMNEHLRVLRSLMPGSYVQRGDQASIIGGAIEFVRELEQLLQCLESQKRRRLFGDAPRQMGGDSSIATQQPQQPQLLPPLSLPNEQLKLLEFENGLREETAESKSCLADIEIKLLGFDAVIKILSRRRPGQLIKTIAAIEDLQLNILHTNITTIEQTVLYTFNVKISSESRFSAEDIASSVQQIFTFIHANTSM